MGESRGWPKPGVELAAKLVPPEGWNAKQGIVCAKCRTVHTEQACPVCKHKPPIYRYRMYGTATSLRHIPPGAEIISIDGERVLGKCGTCELFIVEGEVIRSTEDDVLLCDHCYPGAEIISIDGERVLGKCGTCELFLVEGEAIRSTEDDVLLCDHCYSRLAAAQLSPEDNPDS